MPLTARLSIEPLAESHAAGLFVALDHPQVGRYIGGPDVTSLDALVERIRFVNAGPGADRLPEQWYNAAVRLRSDDTIIGRVEATTYDGWAEIAYVFSPRWSGEGYATEATQWLVDDLCARGCSELWAAVHPENAASVRLLDRLGFEQVDRATRPLGSYDEGDLVLCFECAANGRVRPTDRS